jgi:hypothetical protein
VIQQATRGQAGAGMEQGMRAGASAVGRTLIDYGIGMGWTWFGTWAAALFIAVAAGAAGASRLPDIDRRLEARRHAFERDRRVGPMTPVPGT